MGLRLALLIGVANYSSERSLPACDNDLETVSELIPRAAAFDDVVVIGDSPSSKVAKERIAEFVRRFQDIDVDEVLFYYTGHGSRRGEDFIFLFSDYDCRKIEQPSFRNSELDEMIKSISPGLMVKIVDACHSGVEYVKSESTLEDVLWKSAKSSYKRVYFFFSSASTEPSIAYSDLSVFTKSFANCIAESQGRELRYRDLMAYIADDRDVKKHQTPLFIQQANNTEVFCVVSEELASHVSQKIAATKVPESQPSPVPANEGVSDREDHLLSEVKSQSKDYCSESQALADIGIIPELSESFDWGSAVNELFQIQSIPHKNFDAVPGIDAMAEWLIKAEEPYFADVSYTEEEYETKERVEIEDPRSLLDSQLMMTPRKRIEYKNVMRYRQVPGNITQMSPAACCLIIISFSPKEEVLPWLKGYIGFILSKRRLTLFCKHELEIEKSWSKRDVANQNEWKLIHSNLKNDDEVKKSVELALAHIKQGIFVEVEARVGLR